MQKDFGDHLQRIKNRLDKGRDILRSITPENLTLYAVPGVVVNPEYVQQDPPNEDDV